MDNTGSQPAFYDTHAHLDYTDFSVDLDAVIARAEAAGIKRVITIGTDLDSSARAIALSEKYPLLFAAVGWHPNDADKAPEDLRPTLRDMARHPKVVALGETGLDYYHLPSTRNAGSREDDERHKQRQAEIFRQHLEVAAETGLNCVVHQRNAYQAVLDQMRPFENRLRAVFHCFVEEPRFAEQILAKNWLVSFTGIATFKNAQSLRDTIAMVPIDRMMLETDSPFLAPMPHRGKRCEPAYVAETAKTIAQVKRCSLEELSVKTCATAHGFFAKMAHLG